MLIEIVFWINLFCSCFMTGLIWFVQLVQYPSFGIIDKKDFPDFLAFHNAKTDWIVKPIMSIEFATSGALMWFADPFLSVDSLGFFIVLSIWLSTALFQVPVHYKLEELGNEPKLVSRLVNTNWIRTVLWSIKVLVGFAIIVGY